MITGVLLFILCVLFFAFFIFYKRGMLNKMFSLQAAAPADQLQQQLEKTADAVIRRLETQIAHLEFLLDEADIKIAELDKKLQKTEQITEQFNDANNVIKRENDLSPDSIDVSLPPEKPLLPEFTVDKTNLDITETVQYKDSKDAMSNEKRKLILKMAEQGYNVTEIAKSTGHGKGEIMLLLQLHRK